ncbi:uncharacterized protein SCHCODRAFT_02516124 [Schizophyllum commune H4-8]|uniref:Expressed protein n=1 Tax=Schizophyllum commune (strain H4-8 / FGSC 9210) TaxID=578458 RepID=D8QGW8_SCHCM|nr:uncharacterized protein SCHCODRAFT_02516124 [Schizophyllum commune H4-8]KAI5886926.1 hypothetical protein SCHCODRAFT_02516124 [Schizophyllum commune H4-8]
MLGHHLHRLRRPPECLPPQRRRGWRRCGLRLHHYPLRRRLQRALKLTCHFHPSTLLAFVPLTSRCLGRGRKTTDFGCAPLRVVGMHALVGVSRTCSRCLPISRGSVLRGLEGISTGAGDALARCRRRVLASDTGERASSTPAKRLQPQRHALFLNIDMSYVVKRADPTASTSTLIAMPLARSAPRGQRAVSKTAAKATNKGEGSEYQHEGDEPGRRVCLRIVYPCVVLRDAIASFSLTRSRHARGPRTPLQDALAPKIEGSARLRQPCPLQVARDRRLGRTGSWSTTLRTAVDDAQDRGRPSPGPPSTTLAGLAFTIR